jgi:hypothetical protein
MSLSVEVKFQGDVATAEHQAAIKQIMDDVVKSVNTLPGLVGEIKGNRFEVKSSSASRHMEDGLINPEPFPTPTGFMHEAKLQFGFHLNPVANPSEDKS